MALVQQMQQQIAYDASPYVIWPAAAAVVVIAIVLLVRRRRPEVEAGG